MKYEVIIYLSKEERNEVLKGTVEFEKRSGFDYGNGYGMFITGLGEPFGGQGYDIRYDIGFYPEKPFDYISKFYSGRFSGKDGKWNLDGISIRKID